MRLLFVSHRYWPAIGGIEAFLRHVTRELSGRHDVTVLTQRIDDRPWSRLTDSVNPPPEFESFQDLGARIVPLRASAPRRAMATSLETPGLRRYLYGRGRATAAALLARAVAPAIAREARQADILHLWGGNIMTTAVVRAARQAGIPAVITPFAHRGQWGDDAPSGVSYRAADRVLALLRSDASLYRELGVATERTEVVGVCSPGVPAGGGEAIRRGRGITGPVVLFLGARRPYKGADLLIAAAPIVATKYPGVTFVFIGPGDPIEDVPGVRVIDAGTVDDGERAAWLDCADLMCLPSAAEIFPVSVLEAWSSGTPVLLSDLEPLTELIELSGGGRTTARNPQAIAAAIVAMIADERLAEQGEAGRSFWAERHTVGAVAASHEAIYEDLAGAGTRLGWAA